MKKLKWFRRKKNDTTKEEKTEWNNFFIPTKSPTSSPTSSNFDVRASTLKWIKD